MWSSTSSAVRRLKVLIPQISVSLRACKMTGAGPTVGIIIIGDEILKGQVRDTNSHFLCKKLFGLGVKVHKVAVVPDDLSVIAKEVNDFSGQFTHVITSGGIGPTHDDVTFEGVAQAFGDKLHMHPDLVEVIKNYFKTDDVKSPKFKLANIPSTSTLHFPVDKKTGVKGLYPVVNVKNVYIFPGVPRLMENAFTNLEDLFRNPDIQFHVKEVFLNKDEMTIAEHISKVSEQFKDKVTLGSYPDFCNSYFKIRLTMEAERTEYLEDALKALTEVLPENSIVDYDKDPMGNAVPRLTSLLSSTEDSLLVKNVKHAAQIIESSLERYSLDEICVGFNGGKDCTAILHLFYAIVKRKFPNENKKIKALYIRRGQPFPEVELFIKSCVERYNLEILNFNGRIKESLTEMKTTNPEIKAVVMGTRRSDPYSNHLEGFSITDKDWPQYMRVNPILDWSYCDVWAFLRTLCLEYCSLYDRGYTSLGSMENTHPNPDLKKVDDRGIISYRPAFRLMDSQSERAGRN